MPQLPSGKKVGTHFEKILELIDNPFFHLDHLGKIEFKENLYPLMPVIIYQAPVTGEGGAARLNSDSNNTHEVDGLVDVEQDYSVADVLNHHTDWPGDDTLFFHDWVHTSVCNNKCEELLVMVEEVKTSIAENVDAMAYMDIDPDQDERERFRRASVFVNALTLGNRKNKEPN